MALSNLTKLVMDQHQMMCELKNVQEGNLVALQHQIAEVRASVLEEQRAGLSEMRVDQRILQDLVVRVIWSGLYACLHGAIVRVDYVATCIQIKCI